MAHFCHKNGLNPPRLAGSAGKWIKMDWKADFMGSGQIRETQRISTVNPRRGVAKAPSAGAQTPRTQAISSVCAKRGAAGGDPRRPQPGGAEPLPKMDWKADPMGSGQIRETQRISTVNPRRRVAEAPSAGARTGLTQGISTVCAK